MKRVRQPWDIGGCTARRRSHDLPAIGSHQRSTSSEDDLRPTPTPTNKSRKETMTVPIPESEDTLAELIDTMYRLAGEIHVRFMPSVFNCECQGTENTCRKALQDGRVWERKDAIDKVVAHLRAEAARYEEAQAERERVERRAEIDAWHKDRAASGQR